MKRALLIIILLHIFCVNGECYTLIGAKWINSEASFHVGHDNDKYDSAFIEALESWNNLSNFTYTYTIDHTDPCEHDYENSYSVSDKHCTEEWDSSTLGITRTWYVREEMVEADIVMNSKIDWGIFYGPGDRVKYDFRRVVAHELGHALGLDHSETKNSLMYYRYQDEISSQQSDDINGLNFLYGSSNSPLCSYTLSHKSTHFDYFGGEGVFEITTDSSCSWTAATNDIWFSLYKTDSTTGNGSVSYNVEKNTGSIPRAGSISVAGHFFIITQDDLRGTGVAPVYRFYNEQNQTHFYTISELESNNIQTNLPHYRYEGIRFYALERKQENTSPVYRFYNPKTTTHFYTISAAEKEFLLSTENDYVYEGTAYHAYKKKNSSASPVYRFYNTATGAHFYTMSEEEKDTIIETLPSYKYEGIAYFTYTVL